MSGVVRRATFDGRCHLVLTMPQSGENFQAVAARSSEARHDPSGVILDALVPDCAEVVVKLLRIRKIHSHFRAVGGAEPLRETQAELPGPRLSHERARSA